MEHRLNFFSGKGFEINTSKNQIYLYRHTGKIHIHGEFCNLLHDYQEPCVHIFNDTIAPSLIYFTPVLMKDNINTKSRAKEAVKMTQHTNYHYSGSCLKLFKDMNIPAGDPKQKSAKSSGHHLEYVMINFLSRDCAVIKLDDITSWMLF